MSHRPPLRSLTVDLTSSVTDPDQAADYTNANGQPVYLGGPNTYRTFTATFGNQGTETLPAGAIFSIGFPVGAFWDDMTFTTGVSYTGPTTDFVNLFDTSALLADREWKRFTLTQPLAPGAQFVVNVRARLRANPQPGEAWEQRATPLTWPLVRIRTDFQVGASGATDSNTGNNQGASPTQFVINQPQ